MDGHFVPNLSFGIPVLRACVKRTTLPVDVHLMVDNPERLLEAYLDCGPAWLSVHYEATTHLDRALAVIRARGVKAGVVLESDDTGGSPGGQPAAGRLRAADVGQPGLRRPGLLALRARQGTPFA